MAPVAVVERSACPSTTATVGSGTLVVTAATPNEWRRSPRGRAEAPQWRRGPRALVAGEVLPATVVDQTRLGVGRTGRVSGWGCAGTLPFAQGDDRRLGFARHSRRPSRRRLGLGKAPRDPEMFRNGYSVTLIAPPPSSRDRASAASSGPRAGRVVVLAKLRGPEGRRSSRIPTRHRRRPIGGAGAIIFVRQGSWDLRSR